MSKEKQIEEMARTLNEATFGVNVHTLADHLHPDTINRVAEYLYNAGYRKQSDGEWIEHREMRPYIEVFYICSKCGRKEFQKEQYCHCGAKMKGGAE